MAMESGREELAFNDEVKVDKKDQQNLVSLNKDLFDFVRNYGLAASLMALGIKLLEKPEQLLDLAWDNKWLVKGAGLVLAFIGTTLFLLNTWITISRLEEVFRIKNSGKFIEFIFFIGLGVSLLFLGYAIFLAFAFLARNFAIG
jgi:hypothetical protein